MPWPFPPLSDYLTLWHNAYGSLYADLYTASNYLHDAKAQCDAHNWAGLGTDLNYAGDYILNAANHVGTGVGSVYYHMWSSMTWIALNWPAGGAVTMAAILSAMLGAKFTELQDFIGIEDAYRVALWNAPFNANFYAALARGFIKWP